MFQVSLCSSQGKVAGVEGLGAMQLAAAAGCLDWEDFDHRMGQIEADPQGEVGDLGRWALHLAAELAVKAGEKARAVRARAVANELQAEVVQRVTDAVSDRRTRRRG